jgi:hypothetical protein
MAARPAGATSWALAPEEEVADADAAEALAPDVVAVAKPVLAAALEAESVALAVLESVAAPAVVEPVAVALPVLEEEVVSYLIIPH